MLWWCCSFCCSCCLSSFAYAQNSTACCPEHSLYGPHGPFAPRDSYDSEYAAASASVASYSDDDDHPKHVEWSQHDEAAADVIAACEWGPVTEPEGFRPTRDLTTGVVHLGYINGTCESSHIDGVTWLLFVQLPRKVT